MSETIRKPIKLSEINIDSGTQVRVELNQSTVDRYAERMQDGQPFPDVIVFSDGVNYYLADGFHRFFASKKAGRTEIISELHQGTLDDAVWYALGGNKRNGLPMEDTDIQKSIKIALERFPQKSTRQIAEQIGCSFQYVNKISSCKHLSTSGQLITNGNNQEEPEETPQVIGKDGKSYPAKKSKKAKFVLTAGSQLSPKPITNIPECPPDPQDTTGDLFDGYSDEIDDVSPEEFELEEGYVKGAIRYLEMISKENPYRSGYFDTVEEWIRGNR